MARIQMNYPGVGTASLDLCLPVEADGGSWENPVSWKRWPVIWLLHGEGESCGDWFRYTLLEEYAKQAGIAVVCPTIENSFGVNLKHGDPWENFLTGSLRQGLFSMFPLSEKREDNWIAGNSMGGYAALRLAFRHPELFAGAAAFDAIVDLSVDKLSYWWNAQQLDYVFQTEEDRMGTEYSLLDQGRQCRERPQVYLSWEELGKRENENRELAQQLCDLGFQVEIHTAPANKISTLTRDQQLREWLSKFHS